MLDIGICPHRNVIIPSKAKPGETVYHALVKYLEFLKLEKEPRFKNILIRKIDACALLPSEAVIA